MRRNRREHRNSPAQAAANESISERAALQLGFHSPYALTEVVRKPAAAMPSVLSRLANDIEALDPRRFEGRVTGLSGALIEASGPVEGLALGARATIHGTHITTGEIVGFRGDRALIAPFDPIEAIRPGARVSLEGGAPSVRPSRGWLGRIINCFGQPVDGEGPLPLGIKAHLVRSPPPSAHDRRGSRRSRRRWCEFHEWSRARRAPMLRWGRSLR